MAKSDLKKRIYGKTYKYFGSAGSLYGAKKWAKSIRKNSNVYSSVKKDPRAFASTYHIYIRKKRRKR